MTTLMQASQQWASRPADERFVSLHEMGAKMRDLRDRSRQTVESTRKIELFPDEADPKHRGLYLGMDAGPLAGAAMAPTHWSFGQLCSLASPGNSPASYFSRQRAAGADDRRRPQLQPPFFTKVDEVGLLAVFGEDTAVGTPGGALRAATGPNYGRVWNAEVVEMLIDKFGDGISGDWRVPVSSATGYRRPPETRPSSQATATCSCSSRTRIPVTHREGLGCEPPRRCVRSGSLRRGISPRWSKPMKALFVSVSQNAKTGPMARDDHRRGHRAGPAARSTGKAVTPSTAPSAISGWRLGGYARWSWDELCANVAALPKRILWRYAQAGDLPGADDAIDARLLSQLVIANRGKRVIAFTHC